MNEVTTITPNLYVAHNQVLGSSEDVARAFGKRHDNVLQAIDNLSIPDDFRRANFQETVKLRHNPVTGGQLESRAVMMTRDGFSLLVMGFTGREAMRFKIAWLEAFNRMEAELARSRDGRAAALRAEVLRLDPRLKALLRYRKMGLSRRELALLLRVGASTVGVLMRRLRDLGFIEEPPRQLSLFVKKEVAP